MERKKIYKILTLILVMQWAFIQILAQYPIFIEKYYSNGLYIYISKFLRLFLGWIPFSIGDILLVLFFLFIVKNIYQIIKTKKFNLKDTFFKVGAYISVLFFFFYLFWGLNYFRVPLKESLDLNDPDYTTEDVKYLTKKLIEKTNKAQVQITNSDTIKVTIPYNHKEIYSIASKSYNHLTTEIFKLKYPKPSIKSSLISTLQSYMGTGGYINPLTGEAQVNSLIPKTSTPAISCHEIAHQVGYAAENEANFIGFLVAANNSNPYFRYSGYKAALNYSLRDLYLRDSTQFKELYKNLNKGILKDFEDHKKYAKKYQNPIEPYIWKTYNMYLKANKQKDGVQSYNKMISLLINYQKKYPESF